MTATRVCRRRRMPPTEARRLRATSVGSSTWWPISQVLAFTDATPVTYDLGRRIRYVRPAAGYPPPGRFRVTLCAEYSTRSPSSFARPSPTPIGYDAAYAAACPERIA